MAGRGLGVGLAGTAGASGVAVEEVAGEGVAGEAEALSLCSDNEGTAGESAGADVQPVVPSRRQLPAIRQKRMPNNRLRVLFGK